MSCLRIAVLQLKSGADKTANLANARKMMAQAKKKGCQLAILPECFNSPYGINHFPQYAEPIPGPSTFEMSDAAKEHDIWLVAGTIPERSGDKLYNTCTVFNPKGDLIATYRKMHLFDVNIPGKIKFEESSVLTEGQSTTIFEIGQFKIGLGICFDLRFPELALHYSSQGCNLLIYPSAFSSVTGPRYWEVLQRARAIDTQSFVVTAAPAVNLLGDFQSHGHSMVISPDGSIMGEIDGQQEDILVADIDMSAVANERLSIPILKKKKMNSFHFPN